jgi:hypothetical protein
MLAMTACDQPGTAPAPAAPADPARAVLTRGMEISGGIQPLALRAPGEVWEESTVASSDGRIFGDNPYVASTVDIEAPGAGAAAMAYLRAALQPNATTRMDFPAPSGARPLRVYLWDLPFASLGDESFARWFDAADGGKGALVVIRRGDTITFVRHFAVGTGGAQVDTSVTEQLARRADRRLADALRSHP